MVFYVGADGLFEFAGAAWDVVELLGVHGAGYGGEPVQPMAVVGS